MVIFVPSTPRDPKVKVADLGAERVEDRNPRQNGDDAHSAQQNRPAQKTDAGRMALGGREFSRLVDAAERQRFASPRSGAAALRELAYSPRLPSRSARWMKLSGHH